MPRLVTFGCSYVFGDSLPDTTPLPQKIKDRIPSKFAWPQVLANLLGYDCLNNGWSASGNYEILLKILKTEFLSDDLVIIAWSHFTRYDFYKVIDGQGNGQQIFENNTNFKTLVAQLKLTDTAFQSNLITKNWLCISHANLYLNSKNIKNYFFLNTTDWENKGQPTFIPTVDGNLNLTRNDYVIDHGFDGTHPGIESHKLLSNLLYKKIK